MDTKGKSIWRQLQEDLLAGARVNTARYAAAHGVSRDAVLQALKQFGPLVVLEGFGRSALWHCADAPGLAAFTAPVYASRKEAVQRSRMLGLAPTIDRGVAAFMSAWGLALAPCETAPGRIYRMKD